MPSTGILLTAAKNSFILLTLIVSASLAEAQETRQDLYGDPLPPGAIARLGTIRLRHEANMTTGVAFSADGKWMATATNNAPDINVWEIATGKRAHRFTKQQPDDPDYWEGRALAFTADGKGLYVMPLYTSEINRIDLDTGQREVISEKLLPGRTAFQMSADGRRAAMADKDATVHIIEVATSKEIAALKQAAAGESILSFSADGKHLAIGQRNSKQVEVWDVDAGKSLWKKSTEGNNATVSLSSEGNLLVATTSEDGFTIYQMPGGEELFNQPKGRQPKHGSFSPDGARLATADGFGKIDIWDIVNKEKERTIDVGSFARRVDMTPDGKRLVVSYSSNTFRIFDLETGEESPKFETQHGFVREVAVNDDGSRVASFDGHGSVVVWDVAQQKPIYRKEKYPVVPKAMALAPSGEQLAFGWGTITLVDVKQPDAERQVEVWRDCKTLVYDPSGKYLAATDRIDKQACVSVIEIASGKKTHTLKTPANVNTITWSADGKQLLTGEVSGEIRIWTLGNDEPTQTMKSTEKGGVSKLALHPGGKGLAVIEGVRFGTSGRLSLWSVTKGARLENYKLSGYEKFATQNKASQVQFSTDGRLVAVSSFECFLWNLGQRKLLLHIGDASNWINRAVLSSDGKRLVTSSSADHLVVWDVDAAIAQHKKE